MCSRSGSLRLGSAKNVRGTRHGGMSRSRLVGGISIGGPLRPTPPSPLPPLRAILQLPRGTQSSAFAERRRTDSLSIYSSPSRVIYPQAASRMRREVWERLLPLSPPHPTRKPSPEILPFPSFIAFVDRSARGGHTRAALSLPIEERYVSGKGQGGGLFNGFLGVPIFVSAFPFQISNARGAARMSARASVLSLSVENLYLFLSVLRDWWEVGGFVTFSIFRKDGEGTIKSVKVYFFSFQACEIVAGVNFKK